MPPTHTMPHLAIPDGYPNARAVRFGFADVVPRITDPGIGGPLRFYTAHGGVDVERFGRVNCTLCGTIDVWRVVGTVPDYDDMHTMHASWEFTEGTWAVDDARKPTHSIAVMPEQPFASATAGGRASYLPVPVHLSLTEARTYYDDIERMARTNPAELDRVVDAATRAAHEWIIAFAGKAAAPATPAPFTPGQRVLYEAGDGLHRPAKFIEYTHSRYRARVEFEHMTSPPAEVSVKWLSPDTTHPSTTLDTAVDDEDRARLAEGLGRREAALARNAKISELAESALDLIHALHPAHRQHDTGRRPDGPQFTGITPGPSEIVWEYDKSDGTVGTFATPLVQFAAAGNAVEECGKIERALAGLAKPDCPSCLDTGTVCGEDADGEPFASLCMECRGSADPGWGPWAMERSREIDANTVEWMLARELPSTATRFPEVERWHFTTWGGVTAAGDGGWTTCTYAHSHDFPLGDPSRGKCMVLGEHCHPMAAARVLAYLIARGAA